MPPNPLLEKWLLGNYGANLYDDPEVSNSPWLASEKSKKKFCKYSTVFWQLCCVAVLFYPALMFSREYTSYTDVELRDDYENNTQRLNADRYLQRPSYHFRPIKNWMNDPNGPMFYKGFYHFFYQYNPHGAIWGNIVWGHAVSKDMIHWRHLDIALIPDKWYDIQGVWSGSVTMREDGVPIILYTGSSYASEQTQNIAYPADPSDPLLRKWVKDHENPILRHPRGINFKDFRDPSTAWKDSDGHWLMTIGAKMDNTGIALLYKSTDLKHWVLLDNVLHAVLKTGMWECVDFYPVAVIDYHGLETFSSGPDVMYVLKASLDDDRHDYYALSSYDTLSKTFHPDDPAKDTGIGLRYDYGKFYASKTFFDPVMRRRILWGWVNESDSQNADVNKGWASVQAIPRTVWYDGKTLIGLIQEPIEEVKTLRGSKVQQGPLKLAPGEVLKISGATGGQLDVEVIFDYPDVNYPMSSGTIYLERVHFDCNQGGAGHRGLFGPFGLLVLGDENLREQTAVFFYISYSREEGKWKTTFCSDQSRSSSLRDVDTTVYGSFVEILPSENYLSLRVLVDKSIVESFVQGGRVVVTSRVYPTVAINQASLLYVFNNATTSISVRGVEVWQMHPASFSTV